MSLLEALIALGIAALIVAAGFESSRLAIERSAIATLNIEAATLAANSLASIDITDPEHFTHIEGRDDNKAISWMVDTEADETEFGPTAVAMTATARVARGGIVAEKTVSILKLKALTQK